jgi:ribonuclease HI
VVTACTRLLKLNVDGGSLGNPERAGCGGVIRGSLGNWKAEFYVYIGHTANPAAELWGIWQGIRLAIDKD